jgi:small-conductance mechanosensitive channel
MTSRVALGAWLLLTVASVMAAGAHAQGAGSQSPAGATPSARTATNSDGDRKADGLPGGTTSPTPAALPDGGLKPKPAAAKTAKKPKPSSLNADGGVSPAAAKKKIKEKKARKALEVVSQLHDRQARAVQRMEKVGNLLKQGQVAEALKELDRAKSLSLEAITATEDLVEEEELTASDYVIRSLITLGIAILIFLLVWLLSHALRRLIVRDSRPAVEGEAPAPGAMLWAYRVVMVIATLGLVGVATFLTIRHVWKVRFSKSQVLDIIEHPLFAFEGRPVTFLSMIFFVLTLAAVVLLAGWFRRLLENRLMPRFSQDVGVQHAFSAILYYVLLFVGLLVSLEVLGVGASTVAIVAGVVGLGIGFGMQHIINNFLSGLVLFFERPVKVGDIVDVGNVEGRVERIRARATTLVTRDNVTIIVPNSEFVQGKVTNLSFPDNRLRCRLKIGVAYGSDVDQVTQTLKAVAAAHPEVLREPVPGVQLYELGDNAIGFELIFWVKEILNRGRIFSDLRYAVVHAFREGGIEIPFPQRDLHLKPSPDLLEALRREPNR